MRLWASTESITLDEFSPRVGTTIEVAFGLSIAYIGASGVGAVKSGFPLDLSALGERDLVQVPQLGRTMTMLRGFVRQSDGDERLWTIDSLIPVRVVAKHGLVPELAEGAACEALGSLYVTGKEMSTRGKAYISATLLRFQSLCLRSCDPRFGQWFDVQRYSDLGADPDVIGAPVCVAELKLEI